MVSEIFQICKLSGQRVFAPSVLSLWVMAALAGSIMGPFGTYSDLDWGQRVLYWAAISGCSVFLSTFTREILLRRLPELNDGWREVWQALGITVLMSPLVFLLTSLFGLRLAPESLSFWKVTLFVFLIAVLFSALRRIYGRKELLRRLALEEEDALAQDPLGMMGVTEVPLETSSAEADCRLLNRMPPGIGGAILHLSARDHFVDVELDQSLVTLRMRFSDAVAEMDGVEGFATHRSHWVAEAAVTGVERENGKLFMTLRNGSRVPISRSARPRLEEAGILQRFAVESR